MRTLYDRADMMRKRNQKRLRTELRLIYDELRNRAEGELLAQFEEALERGEILEFTGTEEEMQDFLVDAVDEYFGLNHGESRDALPHA